MLAPSGSATNDRDLQCEAIMTDLFECCFCTRACTRGLVIALDDGRWRCKAGDACARRVRALERAANAGRCVDCVTEGVTSKRKLATKADGELEAGPRCITHQRAIKKARRGVAHARRLVSVYDITPEQYWALYAVQKGLCFICRKATGATKRLAVEHEHGLCDDHPPDHGCVRCIRALCCGRCNRLVAFLDVEALCRAIELLTDPPARKILQQPPAMSMVMT
jgi:hypothetical protein